MPIHLNVNGSWQEGNKVYVKIAGSWVEADELFIKQAGAWASAWKNEIVFVNNSNRTAASIYALMGSPSNPGTYIFENNAIISAGTSSYALRTGSFPAGSTLLIVNKGTIQGRGGKGGNYNTAGSAGGTALYIDFPCTIDNGAGYIFGGGGGGGGASAAYIAGTTNLYIRAAGGGGAGRNGGSAGSGTGQNVESPPTTISNSRSPASGSASAGGLGGRRRATYNGYYTEVTGGTGGGQGAKGGTGTTGANTTDPTKIKNQQGKYAGGAAGKAIAKNGKAVTISAGNNSTRIKGAVS